VNIIEQIKLMPDGLTTIHNKDKGALSAEFDMAELKVYVASVESLIAQIELGDWTDENGHKLKNSEAFEKVKNL
jgi:hypothetical protein